MSDNKTKTNPDVCKHTSKYFSHHNVDDNGVLHDFSLCYDCGNIIDEGPLEINFFQRKNNPISSKDAKYLFKLLLRVRKEINVLRHKIDNISKALNVNDVSVAEDSFSLRKVKQKKCKHETLQFLYRLNNKAIVLRCSHCGVEIVNQEEFFSKR